MSCQWNPLWEGGAVLTWDSPEGIRTQFSFTIIVLSWFYHDHHASFRFKRKWMGRRRKLLREKRRKTAKKIVFFSSDRELRISCKSSRNSVFKELNDSGPPQRPILTQLLPVFRYAFRFPSLTPVCLLFISFHYTSDEGTQNECSSFLRSSTFFKIIFTLGNF